MIIPPFLGAGASLLLDTPAVSQGPGRDGGARLPTGSGL